MLDHLLAAAGIPGNGIGGDLRSGRQQTARDERLERKNEGRGMATGVGDALAGANPRPLRRLQFRQAKGPRRVDAVRGGGIDDAGIRVVDQRHRFTRGIVGQTQERHIGRVDQPLAFAEILALVGIDLQHLDIGTLGQILVDLQTGRTFLTIDKNFECHGKPASEWSGATIITQQRTFRRPRRINQNPALNSAIDVESHRAGQVGAGPERCDARSGATVFCVDYPFQGEHEWSGCLDGLRRRG